MCKLVIELERHNGLAHLVRNKLRIFLNPGLHVAIADGVGQGGDGYIDPLQCFRQRHKCIGQHIDRCARVAHGSIYLAGGQLKHQDGFADLTPVEIGGMGACAAHQILSHLVNS